jgi:hypothetical protein
MTSSPRRGGPEPASPSPPASPSGDQAITSIDELAWTPIRYPNAIYDHDEQRWISDAEVAEVPFTDSPEPMLAAEATHRDHAIIEQVIADLKDSALAHLPSGHFNAQRCLAGLRSDRRTTSPAPPARWPRPFTPAPEPAPSAPS